MRSPWIILLALLVSSPVLAQDEVELRAAREAAATGNYRHSIELFTEAFEASPELRDQYVLGYYPSVRRRDGKWRTVKIKVNDFGAQVRARGGWVDW